MADMRLFVTISDDLTKVVVELHMDGNALGHIFLDEAGVEHPIKNLQKFRGLLKSSVPTRDPQ